MNLILVCIDTLRYDHLGCNGNDWIQTPNFDAFAHEAAVFDHACTRPYRPYFQLALDEELHEP